MTAADAGKLAADAFRVHRLTPDVLFGRLTCGQVAALFYKPPPSPFVSAGGRIDRLAVLAADNHRRGRAGLPPNFPSWL